MNKLWAPWRIAYVTKKKSSRCIFCSIQKSKSDKKNFVVFRSRHCFAVLNTFPYNNGHVMIVINRHVCSLEKLSNEELVDVLDALKKMIKLLKTVLRPNGFNVGINLGRIAGAGIDDHLHVHIVPRWQGDTNFMPVIGKTKIISQSLNDLYQKLTKCLQKKK